VPFVRAEGEKPPEEPDPKVMAIDQSPEMNLEDPDWRFPIFEWLVKGKLPPDQTEARCIARRPTAIADSKDIVRRCEGCQFYTRQTHLPAQALQTIPIMWPFAV
jgi:hypothetical protein